MSEKTCMNKENNIPTTTNPQFKFLQWTFTGREFGNALLKSLVNGVSKGDPIIQYMVSNFPEPIIKNICSGSISKKVLTDALNEYIVSNPDFYRPDIFKTFEQNNYVSKDLLALLNKKQNESPFDPEENGELGRINSEKLNRLILEYYFPKEIIHRQESRTELNICNTMEQYHKKIVFTVPELYSNNSPWELKWGDVHANFLYKLSHKNDRLSGYLYGKIPKKIQDKIRSKKIKDIDAVNIVNSLFIGSENLYNSDVFLKKTITKNPLLKELLHKHSQNKLPSSETQALNRLVLEEYFPRFIKKNKFVNNTLLDSVFAIPKDYDFENPNNIYYIKLMSMLPWQSKLPELANTCLENNVIAIGLNSNNLNPELYINKGIHFLDYLINQQGINPKNIILEGHCMAGGIATYITKHFHDRGMKINLFANRSFAKTPKLFEPDLERKDLVGYVKKPFLHALNPIQGKYIKDKKMNVYPGEIFKELYQKNPDRINYIVYREPSNTRHDETVAYKNTLHYALKPIRKIQKKPILDAINFLEKLSSKDKKYAPIIKSNKQVIDYLLAAKNKYAGIKQEIDVKEKNIGLFDLAIKQVSKNKDYTLAAKTLKEAVTLINTKHKVMNVFTADGEKTLFRREHRKHEERESFLYSRGENCFVAKNTWIEDNFTGTDSNPITTPAPATSKNHCGKKSKKPHPSVPDLISSKGLKSFISPEILEKNKIERYRKGIDMKHSFLGNFVNRVRKINSLGM
jgi:hypothetical protein